MSKEGFWQQWKQEVIFGLSVAFFLWLIPLVVSMFQKVEIGTIYSIVWNSIIRFMNFNVKVWWISVFLILSFVVLLIVGKVQQTRRSKGKPQEPTKPQQPYLNYRSERFDGIRYSWKYEFDKASNTISITNFESYCPYDERMLVFGECPKCNKHYSNLKSHSQLWSLIWYEIEAKFPDAMKY